MAYKNVLKSACQSRFIRSYGLFKEVQTRSKKARIINVLYNCNRYALGINMLLSDLARIISEKPWNNLEIEKER